MPRPKSVTDEAVIEATGRVLNRLGPARTTLAEVAAETGLAPATLVQRFGSKRGLVLAFAEAAADGAAAPFEAARAKHTSPLAALRAGLAQASENVAERDQIGNSLAVTLGDLGDEELRAAAVRGATATEKAIRELLDLAVQAGELVSADTKGLALTVQAAWNGAVIQWALRGTHRFPTYLERVLAPLLPAPEKKKKA